MRGCIVMADAEKLRQIVLNLFSNAIKFTESGGRLTTVCSLEGGLVSLAVRDTGLGIPPNELDHIFDAFVQVGHRLSQPTEGTGLGLAISREFARGMGGDLSVQSELGVGSTFVLTLPAASDSLK